MDGRKIIIDAIGALAFPGLSTAGKVAYNQYKSMYAMIKHDSAAIDLEIDTAKEILGSYLLTEPEPGRFILKRGNWTISENKFASFHPRSGEREREYITELENVGIAPDMDWKRFLPPEVSSKLSGPNEEKGPPKREGRGR